MNLDRLDQDLMALSVPTVAPGPHVETLAVRLSPRWGAVSRGRMSPRRRAALFVGIALASLSAAAGTYTYHRYVFGTTWTRASSEPETPDEQAFADFDSAHRDEAIGLWKSGQVTLLERKPDTSDRMSVYVVRFDFQDGTSETAKMGDHPNPALRAEWRQIRDAGGGELVSLRRFPNGTVMYVVQYALSSGETIRQLSNVPPMSKADRFAAYDFVTEQMKVGGGRVVGTTSTGMLVVELELPDGHPFTEVVQPPYPRAGLTPERQEEISEMIALGQGDFKDQLFSAQGSCYVVEYVLSDGTSFRMGGDRPVMTDAAWDAARVEAATLYAAGQYTRETVTATDGQAVEVLVITLSTGYVAKIRDVAQARALWGLE
jgi:hypothetical protein